MKKEVGIEFLRFLAILGVVFLHTSSALLPNIPRGNFFEWIFCSFIICLCNFCVPAFFIITGALLLQKKDESYSDFFKKRVLKVLIPFIFWTFIYGLYEKYYNHSIANEWEWFSIAVLKGPVFYHFWFIFEIIGIYLIIPIFRRFVQSASDTDLKYYIVAWFVITRILPILQTYFNFSLGIQFQYWLGNMGYLVLGYYLRNNIHKFQLKLAFEIFIVLIIISVYLMYLGANTYNDYNKFVGIILAMTVPLGVCSYIIANKLFENYQNRNSILDKIIIELGSISFGVYILHAMVLIIIVQGNLGLQITYEKNGALFYVFFNGILTFIITSIIIYILKKISILKFLVP